MQDVSAVLDTSKANPRVSLVNHDVGDSLERNGK